VLFPRDPHLLLQVAHRLQVHLKLRVEVLLLLLVMPLVHRLVSLPAEASTLVPPHQMFLQPATRQALVLLRLQVLLHLEVLLDHQVPLHLEALVPRHLKAQVEHQVPLLPEVPVDHLVLHHLEIPPETHLKVLALLQAVHLL
jgi:hypothetical protein